MTVQASCGETQPRGQDPGWPTLSHPGSKPHLISDVFLVPEQQQVRHGEVEAQVKTGRVVDLRIPATQEEGEDGQAEEEQADNHAHSVKPIQKGIRWGWLRRQGTPVLTLKGLGSHSGSHRCSFHYKGASVTSAICMMRAKVDR